MNADRLRALCSWCASRAWSRAGAIAAVAAAGTPRRVLALTTRVAMLVGGSMTIGASVALMLWNEFGPGPLDVFIGAVRASLGIPLTFAVWVVIGSMIATAWALGRRPGVGTLLSPLVAGPTMQAALATFERAAPPSHVVAQVAVHVAAIGTVGVGAGLMLASGLGAGTGELLAAAASDRSGRPTPHVRLAFELSWLVAGVALGGPIGLGTILVALLIGPSVARGYRLVDDTLTASRRRLAAAFG